MAASCALGIISSVRCGGTTGREGLPDQAADAGPAETDATLLDAGAQDFFDVGITYVDRVLPDVVPTTPIGEAGASYPWPTCPPFIPIGPDGGPIPPGSELDQIPSEYDDSGAVVPAPDGSPCATYPWLGSTAVDSCLTSSASGWGQDDFPLLPPCSWCTDAGTASQGAGAGTSTYTLCLALYTCAMASGCGASQSPSTCLCGDASAAACIMSPQGPCATAELAALQYRSDSVEQALSNYTQIDPSFNGYCGSALNYVFLNAQANACFAASGASNGQ